MGKYYKGPKYFYGSWLSLGKVFFVLHINNAAYERDMTDLFRFYIGWDTLRRTEGEALYPVFELRWSKHSKALRILNNNKTKPAIEFAFQFLHWHYLNGPYNTSYSIFRRQKYDYKEVKND